MTSICSILDEAASTFSGKPLFVFPENRWRGEEVLTYGSLATRAAAAARVLAEHARPGDRALLLYPTGAAFWEAFLGCLAGGIIAVPLNVPNLNRSSEQLQEVCRNCDPSILMTDEQTADLLRRRADKHPELSQLPLVTPEMWRSEEWPPARLMPKEGDIAFLQYTSGSTARPKGVQISHANLLANLEMIRARMGIRDSTDSGVTWLPHHHDMGLVGSYLTTLFTKNTTVCLPPEEFVLRPARWLQLISEHRASICGGPDFAFRMCVEKIDDDQIADIDLSSWRIAYIGSERIRAETVSRFSGRFSPFGFRNSSFFPCYGLGEATLMVTGGPPNVGPVVRQVSTAALMLNRIETPVSTEDCTSLVGSGQASEDCRVVVIDSETRRPLPEDRIGEVHLSGNSVTRGYLRRDDLNQEIFRDLTIDGQTRTYLATGDLGFLSRGDLFITGRVREIIIVRGRNLCPEDIEQRIGDAHDALMPGGAVAFSVDQNGQESLVIAAELKRSARMSSDPETIVSAVRARIVEAFGVNPADILLLRAAAIPRTTSGKPKRLVVRERYIDRTLGHLTGEASQSDF